MKSSPPALALVGLIAALGGCVTFRTPDRTVVHARIGESVRVGAMQVEPVALVEDSRCPAGTQCVWAGRLRIMAKVDGAPAELTLGERAAQAQGQLVLIEATPPARKDTKLYPDEYRFGFSATAQQ